jgi:hypothetical protein
MQETAHKCKKCGKGKLKTWERGSRLCNKVFICFKCDSVFENINGKIIESERLAVV